MHVCGLLHFWSWFFLMLTKVKTDWYLESLQSLWGASIATCPGEVRCTPRVSTGRAQGVGLLKLQESLGRQMYREVLFP